MTKYLFADGCVTCHRTEIVAVYHDAVFGGAAEEAAVESCFAEFETELVVRSGERSYSGAMKLNYTD